MFVYLLWKYQHLKPNIMAHLASLFYDVELSTSIDMVEVQIKSCNTFSSWTFFFFFFFFFFFMGNGKISDLYKLSASQLATIVKSTWNDPFRLFRAWQGSLKMSPVLTMHRRSDLLIRPTLNYWKIARRFFLFFFSFSSISYFFNLNWMKWMKN